MKIGFVGLRKIRTRIVEKLSADNHEVAAWSRTSSIAQEFDNSKF